MKRLYTIGMGLSIALFSTTAIAQVQIQKTSKAESHPLTIATKSKTETNVTPKGDDPVTTFWAEDFSNGFDGMGDNGAWDTAEDQGELWFVTYPPEVEGGYDPLLALPNASIEYGTQIPNYFTNIDIVSSPTRDNGLMMLDGDRWNSTSTEENPEGSLTQNSFLAALVSPAFSLEGAEYALLTYYQNSRVCCSGYGLSVDLSVDGGATWIPYDGYTPYGVPNEEVNIQVAINISDVLQGADDLSDCRLRFFWNGSQSHYYWMLDDIAIVTMPDNDVAAGETWYSNHYDVLADFEADEDPMLAVDYYDEFEYLYTPDYYTRDLNFGMAVTNAGSQIQTDVRLSVTATAPDETTTFTWETPVGEGITLESGVIDTITFPGANLADMGDLQYGNYTFDYIVFQAEEDERPDDNIGDGRGTNVSMESEDVYAPYFNGENSYSGAYTTLGQDAIFGTAYVFPYEVENKVITHVEAVFMWSEDFAETIAGEVVYFNVRAGSVLEEDDADPETTTTVFFDSDNPITYEAEELAFTIEEENIWYTADGQPFVWSTFELPNPIMIEEGVVYQAEYRIPAAGDNIVFSPTPQGDQEKYSSLLYDFADGAWFFLGNNAMPIRFRTAQASSVNDVTYESGITLLQNYPNPFNNVTRIQYSLDETQIASLEVRDITGKLIMANDLGMVSAGITNTYELNAGSLSAGVYTYSIVTANTQVTRKLTIAE